MLLLGKVADKTFDSSFLVASHDEVSLFRDYLKLEHMFQVYVISLFLYLAAGNLKFCKQMNVVYHSLITDMLQSTINHLCY